MLYLHCPIQETFTTVFHYPQVFGLYSVQKKVQMGSIKGKKEEERAGNLEKELSELKIDLALKNRKIEVENALDKVRAKAMEMRSSAELSETSTILFQQLKELKIDALRTGVGIFDDENTAIELWITSVSQEGQLFFLLDYINVHIHPVFENIIKSRDLKQTYAITKLAGADLLNYYKKMSTYIGVPARQSSSDCEFYYSFFFSAGTINVVSGKELTVEELDIMLRMASVFGLLYTRFLDLKRSEEQAALIQEEKEMLELALKNLKATQSQLIQSEKMASLGELTAGIAHEIQNPLNFVNNFSELNTELIDEMQQELDKGNLADAKLISRAIRENEQKINHHGKRADAIVKGMLQHSRRSSGQKEPTDLNALADEYFRLAYHGLRAKDKSFHATLNTDFDEGLGKIAVIPQDIGRVILNLITNAFYAVDEKKRSGLAQYEPAVWVSTGKTGDLVEVRVKDNGNGISPKVLDKIFQPFFTTKPTGQGTGLGLSLSYDIIKAHAGELTVTSEDGKGAEFIIRLPRT